MTASSEEPTVTDNPEQSRYEAHLGDQLAGYVEYERVGGLVAFTHTVVPDEFGGRGIASAMASASLDDAREKNLKVRPVCPFYVRYLERHPEYADLLD